MGKDWSNEPQQSNQSGLDYKTQKQSQLRLVGQVEQRHESESWLCKKTENDCSEEHRKGQERGLVQIPLKTWSRLVQYENLCKSESSRYQNSENPEGESSSASEAPGRPQCKG